MSAKKQISPNPKNKDKSNKEQFASVFAKYIEKYKDHVYQSKKSDWKDFPVGIKMQILREFCNDQSLQFKVIIKKHAVEENYHKIVITVIVLAKDGHIVMVADGVSVQYTFNFANRSANTCSERAQTIALGKALSILGISATNHMYSAEEMLTFQAMQDFDAESAIDGLTTLASKFSDELKHRIKVNNIMLRKLLPIYETGMKFEDFKEKTLTYLDSINAK